MNDLPPTHMLTFVISQSTSQGKQFNLIYLFHYMTCISIPRTTPSLRINIMGRYANMYRVDTKMNKWLCTLNNNAIYKHYYTLRRTAPAAKEVVVGSTLQYWRNGIGNIRLHEAVINACFESLMLGADDGKLTAHQRNYDLINTRGCRFVINQYKAKKKTFS